MNPFHLLPSILARAIVLMAVALATHVAGAQGSWPLLFVAEGYDVQVFTPQPESFDGTRISARAAVAVKRPHDKQPFFGAFWGHGVLEVDRDSRMGRLTSFTVTDARFPSIIDTAEVARLKAMLSAEFARQAPPIAIDWIVAALESEVRQEEAYRNDPPVILYRETPSVLVYIDGDPVYEPVRTSGYDGTDPVYATGKGDNVERVVNTPFLLVRAKGGDHYLYGSGLWFRARTVNGPWVRDTDVPVAISDLARKVDDTAALIPADGSARIPDIVVSTVPAELVSLDGPPQLKPLPNTSLLYVTNTTADLFLDLGTQEYFLLASGRWFATRDLKNGPWRYVPSNQLPAVFSRIPEGSEKDDVLAHISGTAAANEAVRDASIPQTASVDRRTATVNVTWDGEPRFEPVDATNVYQGVNANTTVLRINGRYHVCDNAVWFEGDTPTGPWTVSTAVPAEVNTIPASSPLYNVRYVQIYDHTDDVVFVGYTPGYLGSYVQAGTVIYGTGYYYDPWPGYWRPRPFTWGFNMYYDPWVGWGWGFGWGFNWYYPGWWGYGYYPYYGYGGCGWWGPYGYYPPVHCHDCGAYYGHRPPYGGQGDPSHPPPPPPGTPATSAARVPPANLYASRTDQGVKPTTVEPASGPAATKPITMPTGKPVMKPLTADHFTDAQGNVFRLDGSNTQQYDRGRWIKVPPLKPGTLPAVPPQGTTAPTKPLDGGLVRPAPRPPQTIQLDRQRGEQRVNDMYYNRQQRSQPPAMRQAPSPAPSRPAPAPGGGGRTR